tara:strand:- start:36 stop:635 length:600 start_codon:yes stop_codon:yes gene_type:complete
MQITERYHNHIGFYQNIFPQGFCSHLITEFDTLCSYGRVCNRQDDEKASKINKEDQYTFIDYTNHRSQIGDFNDTYSFDIISNALQNCFDLYTTEYSILQNVNLNCSVYKMQKTNPGGGYHVWHFEHAYTEPYRVFTYIMYLNTIESAGETELLYQRERIPPQENTAILFPASYTHTHRGNVVHGNIPKYILTGWFTFG